MSPSQSVAGSKKEASLSQRKKIKKKVLSEIELRLPGCASQCGSQEQRPGSGWCPGNTQCMGFYSEFIQDDGMSHRPMREQAANAKGMITPWN
jgi:hypothetical protein